MADILINKAKNRKIILIDIMQADFILFLRSDIIFKKNYKRWYPHTAVFNVSREPKFELFLRSESTKFFDNFKKCLGIENLDELIKIGKEFEQGLRRSFEFFPETLYPPAFMNLENCVKSV